MRAKKTILSVALVGMAVAGAAFAHGPGFGMGPHGGAGMMGPRGMGPIDPAQQQARAQARLDQLESLLKLQPNQVQAWNAYETRVQAAAQARALLRQEMQSFRGDAQAWADRRVTMMKHNAQTAEEINALRKALVATLSPEQKATFEQYAMGPRFAAGVQPGAGPGHGPGHGGRGPGFGRGCMGAA
jgi:hypothetical protein